MWLSFAQNRQQFSTIIVGKLLAQICNDWSLIVIKCTTDAGRLTPFDKKLASLSFYFRKVSRSLERRLFHVQKTTFSGYLFPHLVKFFWNHFQSIKLFVNNGGDPHYKRRTLCSNKNWLMTTVMGCFTALFEQSIHFTVKWFPRKKDMSFLKTAKEKVKKYQSRAATLKLYPSTVL